MGTKKSIDLPRLEREYKALYSVAQSFSRELSHQIERLLESHNATLGFPLQHRVKQWESIADKFERVPLKINSLRELQDLVGLRLILLFKRDLAKVRDLISKNFNVVREYDTQERLKEDQFGYSSIHFVVELQQEWLAVPTLSEMGGLRAEIQVRTLAQHIWAEASHNLQYKQKESVPPTVLRGIYRVSALLETVDLEFERVLKERDAYRNELDLIGSEQNLNVDSLERALDSLLPAKSKALDQEDYADVLEELTHFGITKHAKLGELINKHLNEVLVKEKSMGQMILDRVNQGELGGIIAERARSGVFYTHTGLTRSALELEFGDAWKEYFYDRRTALVKKQLDRSVEEINQ
jgi:putative GTP pyrophosphokinase